MAWLTGGSAKVATGRSGQKAGVTTRAQGNTVPRRNRATSLNPLTVSQRGLGAKRSPEPQLFLVNVGKCFG